MPHRPLHEGGSHSDQSPANDEQPHLVAAGEEVLDVPALLAAGVRLLGSGRSNKNDPNDARSVAIAAMRAPRSGRLA